MTTVTRRPAAAGMVPPLLVLLSPLTQLAYVPISVGLGASLGMSQGQVGITVGVHSLATALAAVFFGPLLDAVPVRRVLIPAVTVTAVASTLLCFIPGFWSLTVLRTIIGISSGAVMLCSFVLVSDRAQGEKARDRGFSLLQTATATGAAASLALGALAAAMTMPQLVFLVLAGYSAVVVLVVVLAGHIGPAATPDAAPRRAGAGTVLRAAGAMFAEWRYAWLMIASIMLGLVIQGTHYGVSVLLESQSSDLQLWQRVLMSILIPCGVFTGSSINRALLRRFTKEAIYGMLWIGLPVGVVSYLTVSVLGGPLWLHAVALVFMGTMLGAMMPLAAAISVGWHPEIRGSATAAESISRSIGQTTGPVVVGVAVGLLGVPWAGSAVLVAAVLGLVASAFMGVGSRRRARAAAHPAAGVENPAAARPIPEEVAS